eukprot:403365056
MHKLPKISIQKYINNSVCVNDFEYQVVSSQAFVFVYKSSESQNVLKVSPNSLAEIGNQSVVIQATSKKYPSIVINATIVIQIQERTGDQPYFSSSLQILKLYMGKTLSYTFPSTERGYYYTSVDLTSVNVPAFLQFNKDTHAMTINFDNIDYTKMSSYIGYFEAKFDMNCKPIPFTQGGTKGGSNDVDYTMNYEVIVKIYVLDLQSRIQPTLESVYENNTIAISFNGSSILREKSLQSAFNLTKFFSSKIVGDYSIYAYSLKLISFNYSMMILSCNITNMQYLNGSEKLIINFTQPYLLGNSGQNYKMMEGDSSYLSIPLTQSNNQTDTQIKLSEALQTAQDAATPVTSSTKPLYTNFEDSNYDSTNFFFTQTDIFIFAILFIVFFMLFVFLHFILRSKTQFFYELIKDYKYNLFIRFGIETYLPVLVSCLITIKGAILGNTFEYASLCMAGFFWLLYTIFFIYTWVFLITKYNMFKDTQEDKELKKFYKTRYNSYYSELELSRLRNVLYYPIFLTHRSIIAYMLIFFHDNFYAQLIIFFCSQLSMLLYLIITRPFKHKITNIIEILNETCVLISIPFLFCFYFYQDDGTKLIIFGWIFVGILVVNVAINVFNAFYQSVVKKIIKLIQKKFGKCLKFKIEKSFKIKKVVPISSEKTFGHSYQDTDDIIDKPNKFRTTNKAIDYDKNDIMNSNRSFMKSIESSQNKKFSNIHNQKPSLKAHAAMIRYGKTQDGVMEPVRVFIQEPEAEDQDIGYYQSARGNNEQIIQNNNEKPWGSQRELTGQQQLQQSLKSDKSLLNLDQQNVSFNNKNRNSTLSQNNLQNQKSQNQLQPPEKSAMSNQLSRGIFTSMQQLNQNGPDQLSMNQSFEGNKSRKFSNSFSKKI